MEHPKITIATYNVLADAYVKPEYYPGVDARWFKAPARYERVVERIAKFGTDVICLQEADYALFVMAEKRLRTLGYEGRWAHKGMGKPDGCAMFLGPRCERGEWQTTRSSMTHTSKASKTGHLVLLAGVECGGMGIVVATTHLKWMPAEKTPVAHTGYVQAEQVVDLMDRNWGQEYGQVVCGDFNALPDSPIIGRFADARFADAHSPFAATFLADGKPQKLDYLLYSHESLRAEPHPTPDIRSLGPLPSEDEPSDHLPLIATFSPKE